jgi:hypothetical protein
MFNSTKILRRWFMWRMESLALVTVMVSGIVIVATKVENRFDIHHAHFSLISEEFHAV